jgi:hypothetical protein
MAVALTQQQAPPRSPAPVGSLLPQGGRGGGPKACRRKGSGSSHIYPGTTISPRMRREGSSAGFESIDFFAQTSSTRANLDRTRTGTAVPCFTRGYHDGYGLKDKSDLSHSECSQLG